MAACEKSESGSEDIKIRLDKLEKTQIASLQEQIRSITTSISSLETADKELKSYIENIQTPSTDYESAIEELNAKIESVKGELKSGTESAKKELQTKLESLQKDLNTQVKSLKSSIQTLQKKDTEIESQIADLKAHIKAMQNSGTTQDWVTATFATIEQHQTLSQNVATVKEQINAVNGSISQLEQKLTKKIADDIQSASVALNNTIQQKTSSITTAYKDAIATAKRDITAAYTAAIQSAVAGLETSMKGWVNSQLEGYCTIAQADARIAAIKNSVDADMESVQENMLSLQASLQASQTAITAAYKKAIEEAIEDHEGNMDGALAEAIEEINGEMELALTAINARISTLEQRLGIAEGKIATIEEQIANITASITTLEQVKVELENAIVAIEQSAEEKTQQVENQIKALKEKDVVLQTNIDNLKEYADTELANTEEWAEATFATLEKFSELSGNLNDIAALIDLNKLDCNEAIAAASESLLQAIEDSEGDMQAWVNLELQSYATVTQLGQLEAALEAMKTLMGEEDEALMEEIEALAEEMDDMKADVKEAYESAITEAINVFAGGLDNTISEKVSAKYQEIAGAVPRLEYKMQQVESKLAEYDTRIGYVEAQVSLMRNSLDELKAVDNTLQQYITSLQTTVQTLESSFGPVYGRINNVRAELEEEIVTVRDLANAKLARLENELTAQVTTINTAIEALQAEDVQIKQQIVNLNAMTNGRLGQMENWAEATFATLEQSQMLIARVSTLESKVAVIEETLSSLQSDFEETIEKEIGNLSTLTDAKLEIKAREIKTAYEQAIQQAKAEMQNASAGSLAEAISTLETSMTEWVNSKFAGYYTIGEIEGKLAGLRADLTSQFNSDLNSVRASVVVTENTLSTSISANSDLITALQERATSLEGQCAQNAALLSHYSTTINNNAAKVLEHSSRINTLTSQIGSLQQQLEDIEEGKVTTSDLEAQRNALLTQIEQKAAQITQLTKTNKELIDNNTTLILSVNSSVNQLKAESEAGIAQNAAALAEHTTTLADHTGILAQYGAQISALQTSMAENTALVSALRGRIESITSQITQQYKAAIEEAITRNNGTINSQIAQQIQEANASLNSTVQNIQGNIAVIMNRMGTAENNIQALKDRVSVLEAKISQSAQIKTEILNMIQSVAYVPRYSDGMAIMVKTAGTDNGVAEFDFQISPISAVASLEQNWASVVSVKAVYTLTRAVTYIDLPVISFTADNSTGVITVKVSGENLSNDFFNGNQSASAALFISDGNTNITSDFIPMLGSKSEHINISDANFKAYLVTNFDTDGDRQISYSEALAVEEINLSGVKLAVKSLDGIKHFTNLKKLDCSNNYIAELNLNTKLIELYAKNNPLNTIGVIGLADLEIVDVSNTKLEGRLELAYNNKLKYVHALNTPGLEHIRIPSSFNAENITISYDTETATVINPAGNQISKYFVGQYIPFSDKGAIVYKVNDNGSVAMVVSSKEIYDTNANELKSMYSSVSNRWEVPSSDVLQLIGSNLVNINNTLSYYGQDCFKETSYMSSTSGDASGKYVSVSFSYNNSEQRYDTSLYKYADATYKYYYRIILAL